MTGIYTLLGALLKWIYTLVGHYAWAIIIFTIVVKLLLLPMTHAQNRSMKSMQEIQPKIDEIKKKYPNNQEKQSQLTMQLYQEHKINPMMGCLPLLIQLPILFGLFRVLRDPVEFVFGSEAAYLAADQGFLWIQSMSAPDVITIGGFTLPYILPIIAAATTLVDSMLMQKRTTEKSDNPNHDIHDAGFDFDVWTYVPCRIVSILGSIKYFLHCPKTICKSEQGRKCS